MNYTQQGQAISDATQISRVTQALVDTAQDVMAESAATDGHAERAAFAHKVFFTPEVVAKLVIRAVVTNANAGDGTTDDPLVNDNALKFVVTSIWNAYAGYSATP